MKTIPTPTPSARQADPKIVEKTRRDNAAYGSSDSLPGDQDYDYLRQPPRSPQVPRLLESGRSGLR